MNECKISSRLGCCPRPLFYDHIKNWPGKSRTSGTRWPPARVDSCASWCGNPCILWRVDYWGLVAATSLDLQLYHGTPEHVRNMWTSTFQHNLLCWDHRNAHNAGLYSKVHAPRAGVFEPWRPWTPWRHKHYTRLYTTAHTTSNILRVQ